MRHGVHSMLVATVWSGWLSTLYSYLGFPALAKLLIRRRPPVPPGLPGPRPSVTVLISAFNEERHIAERIRNVLASDYPAPLLDVLVISDASTDRTDEIVRSFAGRRVTLLRQEPRAGKTAGLNGAVRLSRGELLVFTDANSSFPPDAISRLVSRFRDGRVGLVTGYTRYQIGEGGALDEAGNHYTKMERTIKTAESRFGCCVGADGAIFAMRRQLYRPLRADAINDLVLPFRVIEQGYQCVLAEDAFCSEHASSSLESEFRRQSRMANRTLRALSRNMRLMNPFRFGVFSFFLFSHKALRYLVPLLLLLSGVALAVLALTDVPYAAVLVAGLLVTLVAWRARDGWPAPVKKLAAFAGVFLTLNAAVLDGWWKFLGGRTDVTWRHDRTAK